MPQIFRPGANTFAKASVFGAVAIVGLVAAILFVLARTPPVTGVGYKHPQPVPYSHALHAGQMAIDCRYCHTTVEISSFANIPSAKICMNCHAIVRADDPVLAPIRDAVSADLPVRWVRVNNLADFVYFNHSAHVNKGVGCSTCHGRIDQMDRTYQARTLFMEWCLGCHRHPERYVRPRQLVFSMDWQPPEDQATKGRELVKEYGIESKTSCSTCHR